MLFVALQCVYEVEVRCVASVQIDAIAVPRSHAADQLRRRRRQQDFAAGRQGLLDAAMHGEALARTWRAEADHSFVVSQSMRADLV